VPELQIIDAAAALRRWAKLSSHQTRSWTRPGSAANGYSLWNALTDVEMGPESRRPGGLSHRGGPERLPKLMFFRPAGLYGANLFTPVGGSAHHNLPRFTRLHSGWCAVERK
jgi:hypothetical protein